MRRKPLSLNRFIGECFEIMAEVVLFSEFKRRFSKRKIDDEGIIFLVHAFTLRLC